MRCPSCGFEHPKSLKFCHECGAHLRMRCAQCGFANQPQAKFCGACGAALLPKARASTVPLGAPHPPPPLSYTPTYLAEKILTSRSMLEGERKEVMALFADLKGSMELLADRDPEEARQLVDPVRERMMAAMHRSEGNANPFTGDGAEGCSNPWGGSGYVRELDGHCVPVADRVPPSHCTETMPGT